MTFTKIEHTKNDTEFVFDNLPTGISNTVVHPIRRFLAMRTPSFACVALIVNKMSHEFESIDGVIEGAFDLINNLSFIRFVVNEQTIDNNTFIARLSTNVVGDVLASEFQSDVEIVNKNAKICEKTTDDVLEIKALFALETGYRTKEENMRNFFFPEEELSDSEKVIYVDSNHGVVKNFSFLVREIVGNDPREELKIRIETEEGTSPEEILKFALYGCVNAFDALLNDKNTFYEKILISRVKTRSTKYVESIPIEELEISNRSYNCLKNKGITSLNQLANITREDVSSTKNFGNVSMQEISAVMQKHGIKFKDED